VHAAAAESVRAMNGYVRETLSFSERLEPRFEIVDVLKLCHSAPELLGARANALNIRIAVQCEQQIALCGDRVLLERVLANLVSNAIDVSAPGQTISISASHGQTGWLRLEVTDLGTGIAPENLTRIFDPYFTTKRFGQDVRGFGLGLTICQKIVLLHSGRISAKSELGHGTTIMVDLPVDQNPTVSRQRDIDEE
jgi:signal transduction histidine kinase